jgi:hypothetical protein
VFGQVRWRDGLSERRTKNGRGWIAAGVFVALIAGAILLVRPSPAPEPARPVADKPAKTAPIELPPPLLERRALIEAAAEVADAAATGRSPPPAVAALAGRRFLLVVPFGCNGPGSEGPLSWTYDEGREALRVRVTPQIWSEDERVKALAGTLDYEAAEGFWVARPWIRSGDCPVGSSPVSPAGEAAIAGKSAAPPEQPKQDAAPSAQSETLGLIQFFEPGSRRAARRNGRAYTLSERLKAGEIDLARGLRLVIEGRLAALPSGQPVVCHVVDGRQRPLCMINAAIDRVAITDASGARLLAEWTD